MRNSIINITEVIRRTDQGVTQPYICVAEDGSLYFVKGKGAGYSSLAKEWIGGWLARMLHLPIPDFSILNVPKELFELGKDDWLSALGYGPVFGSKSVSNSNEISFTNLDMISSSTKRDIACFDWWILNGDRTLSENGGNPNILWEANLGKPFIIDHNLAFDPSVTLSSLETGHIFGSYLSEVVDDHQLQTTLTERFATALANWDSICEEMPTRWNYLDDSETMLTGFAPSKAIQLLRRIESASMWTRP